MIAFNEDGTISFIGSEDCDSNVRTDYAIPKTRKPYYFDVKIISSGDNGEIVIGLTEKPNPVTNDSMPGWDKNTIGYHGDDGGIYHETETALVNVETFTSNDVVGCQLKKLIIDDNEYGLCTFTKNGRVLGSGRFITWTEMYPTIGLASLGAIVQPNLSGTNFLYDFEGKVLFSWMLLFYVHYFRTILKFKYY